MFNQLRWLWLSAFIFLFDQASKSLAKVTLFRESITLLPVFNLNLAHNTGASFGFLSSAGGWQRWLFIAIAAGVSLFIVGVLYKLPRHKNWEACSLGLILGGAAGNLADRIRYGYVIDFIQVHYQGWYFPTFNLADSAITIGVIIWLIVELTKARS
jgi:signal peptidase II